MRRNLNLVARNFHEMRGHKNISVSKGNRAAWDTDINRLLIFHEHKSLSDEAKEEHNDSQSDKAKDNAKKERTEISNSVVYSDLKGKSYKYHA